MKKNAKNTSYFKRIKTEILSDNSNSSNIETDSEIDSWCEDDHSYNLSNFEALDQLSNSDEDNQIKQWKTETYTKNKNKAYNDIRWKDVGRTNKNNNLINIKKPILNIKFSSNLTPIDCFRLFLTDDILNYIVHETNKNADQIILKAKSSQKNEFISENYTSKEELEIFLGLLLWMNQFESPSLEYCWCNNKLYKNSISNIMSQKRFETIFQWWPLSNKEHEFEDDHNYKVRYIISILVQRFKEIRIPGSLLTIGKYNLPIKQSISRKQHIKIFKLCTADNYTYNMMLYEGKQNFDPTEVILRISEDYLNDGRVIVTNEYFTSLSLAHNLLKRNTHLVGTLTESRKGIPCDVLFSELKKGEISGKINENGVVIAKWNSGREQQLLLSTFHNLDIVKIERRNRNGEYISKPKIVKDYNEGIIRINMSDHVPSFISIMQESLSWYHKVALEAIFESSVTNAFVIYKESHPGILITKKKFRENLIKSLLKFDDYDKNNKDIPKKLEHKFEKTTMRSTNNRKIRKRCVHCYETNKKLNGSKFAACASKKVSTFCSVCPNKPFICKECFAYHIETS